LPKLRAGFALPYLCQNHNVYASDNSRLSQGNSQSFGDINIHGVQNVREMMRAVAAYAKNLSPVTQRNA